MRPESPQHDEQMPTPPESPLRRGREQSLSDREKAGVTLMSIGLGTMLLAPFTLVALAGGFGAIVAGYALAKPLFDRIAR